MKRVILLAALAVAACAKAPPPDPNKPESYAVRVAVTPAEGEVQRIRIPASVLAVLRSWDWADVRLFDASGRSLPLALGGYRLDGSQYVSQVAAHPVIGEVSSGTTGVALTIGPDNIAHGAGIANGAGSERTVAALLDTRRFADPVVWVQLESNMPLFKPVTIKLEASTDLKTWEPLGEKVVYMSDVAGSELESGTFALKGVSLKDRYLRASWGEAKGVSIRSAWVAVERSAPLEWIAVATDGAKLANPRELTFVLPNGGPAAAIRIDPTANEGVIPVKLAARDNAEAPWLPLTTATLRTPGSPGNVIELGRPTRREYRLTADARTPGFATPPKVELLFEPVELLARFNGKAPYTLAAGLAGAPSTLLAAADLTSAAPPSLPSAGIASGAVPKVSLAGLAEPGGRFGKQALLWAALLAGTAVLAFAVWRLMRGNQAPVS